MPGITVHGRSKWITNQETQAAAVWMLNHLLGDKISRKLKITIKIKRLRGLRGDCIWVDSNHKPKEFAINLSSRLCYETFLTILAHELVHVKQFVRGELMDYVRYPGVSRWQGRPVYYDDDYYTHPTLPWEIEAYGYQSALCSYYLTANEKI